MSKYVIETKNLTKQYGTQKSVANLNIHVQRGRIYGLLGRNGAGKTTTMKMLLGLTQPTSGEVGLPYKDKKLFSQYSLGMKQRLAIALAIMHDPELLILDEPINGLDPIGIVNRVTGGEGIA